MPPPAVGRKTAVALSAITYCTDPQAALNKYLPGWQIVWNGQVTPDGNYAFIATDIYQYNHVLSVRGSLPPWDIFDNWDAFANWILEDFDALTQQAWPYSYVPGAMISSGSMTAFTNLGNMTDSNGTYIYNFLRDEAVRKNKPITITGHSLGGNMANLYASWLPWNLEMDGHLKANLALYTFAAPAAGNQAFASDLDEKIPRAFHFEISNDIVPKFPVYAGIQSLEALFVPKPAADQIYVDKPIYLTLAGAINILSQSFSNAGYQQVSNNYEYLDNALSPQYEHNNIKNWFMQAGYQHEAVNYCLCLGVPPIQDQAIGETATVAEIGAAIADE